MYILNIMHVVLIFFLSQLNECTKSSNRLYTVTLGMYLLYRYLKSCVYCMCLFNRFTTSDLMKRLSLKGLVLGAGCGSD